MPKNSRLPALEVLDRHRKDGMSIREIGQRYGVGGEAVRLAYKRHGVELPRERNNHAHYLPWRLRANHAHDTIARRLRAYSKVQQGIEVPKDEVRLLERWQEFMDGDNPYGVPLSVHYDRNDPDGFWLGARQEGDRHYIHPPDIPRT